MLDADCCICMVCWMLDAYMLYHHGLFRYPPRVCVIACVVAFCCLLE